ncbi:CTD small phosphatase-like protein 2-A [Trichinella pseudospiralis]|uniref:Mitochondrial import inner membrane translocase subunit TIM50 n=1 Tax=Trichinella pseudospiralis TaxID=6337 RepID=A0A0V1DUR4_TRIPS|nr:CTD small phosphatase-like protein 2-A [Trichinella pseudospiralis]
MEWKLLEDDSEKKQQKGKRNQQASTSQNASETEITRKLKCLKKIWNDFKRVLCVKKCYKYVNEQPEVDLDTISTNNDKLTIVFDLDSTLVFSRREIQFDEQCSIELIKYCVAIRPHCRTLLETIRPFCNIVVYSAGSRRYVHDVVEHLDGEKKFFDKVLNRNNCQLENGVFIKDLRKTGYPLERTVWIDDKVESFPFQPYNGIVIKPWIGDPKDEEILRILKLIMHLKKEVYFNILRKFLYYLSNFNFI